MLQLSTLNLLTTNSDRARRRGLYLATSVVLALAGSCVFLDLAIPNVSVKTSLAAGAQGYILEKLQAADSGRWLLQEKGQKESSQESFDRLGLAEDATLFRRTFEPLASDTVRKFESQLLDGACPEEETLPYVSAVENILVDPLHYDHPLEDCDNKSKLCCPVILLFYYQENTVQDMDVFLNYYKSLGTRCVLFSGGEGDAKSEEANRLREEGYTVLGSKGRQVQNIEAGYWHVREVYGNSSIVTPNDLDHFLAWHLNEKFYQYSSYSDMVMVYALDMLTTEGCPNNKQVNELFSQPCTCFLEDNNRYIHNEETVFSVYGIHNTWHNTAAFYIPEWRQSPRITGTVFGNLHNVVHAHACHHLVGKATPRISILAQHAGVIHLRHESQALSANKYMHYMVQKKDTKYKNTMLKVEGAMQCALAPVEWLWDNICGNYKEISNLIATIHQAYQCGEAGFDVDHCYKEIGCCLTSSKTAAK